MKSETTFHEDFLEKITNVQWGGKSTSFGHNSAIYVTNIPDSDTKKITFSMWFRIDDLVAELGPYPEGPVYGYPIIGIEPFNVDLPGIGIPGFDATMYFYSDRSLIIILTQGHLNNDVEQLITDIYAPDGDPDDHLPTFIDEELHNLRNAGTFYLSTDTRFIGPARLEEGWHQIVVSYDGDFTSEADPNGDDGNESLYKNFAFLSGPSIQCRLDGDILEQNPPIGVGDVPNDKTVGHINTGSFTAAYSTAPYVYRRSYTFSPEEGEPREITVGFSLTFPSQDIQIRGNNILIPFEGQDEYLPDDTQKIVDASIWLGKYITSEGGFWTTGAYVSYKNQWLNYGKPQYFFTGVPSKFVKNLGTRGGTATKHRSEDIKSSNEFPPKI